MKRDIDINEISDGKLYGPNDMVKADCGDCKGCTTDYYWLGERLEQGRKSAC